MTTLSTCLSALGLFNDDKLNSYDPDTPDTFGFTNKFHLPADDIDPLRSDTSLMSEDPLNMLQDIDHIFSSTSNYSNSLVDGNGSSSSTRTSISSDHSPNFISTDITDIDLDMIQEVLEKEVQSQLLEDPSSDVELDTNEVTVSEADVEEEDVPYFDTLELHNYSRIGGRSVGESSPSSSGEGSNKEDIEPDDDEFMDADDGDCDDNDYESEDTSKDSDDDDIQSVDVSVTKVPVPKKSVLSTKSNRGISKDVGRRKKDGSQKKDSQNGLNKYQVSNGQKLTRRSITDRNLTEEEKRLLAKEGYTNFPKPGTTLTKQEEKVLRKVRRKIRNKKSAQCSRQRKKEYVEELEKKFQDCNSENSVLKKEVLKLKRENSNLLVKMKNLLTGKITPTTGHALVPSGHSNNTVNDGSAAGGQNTNTNGSRGFKTSFFVLFLSFFLVLLPFFNPDSIEDKSLLINTESLEGLYKEPNQMVGRHLMAYNSSPNTQNEGKFNVYSVPNSLFYPKIEAGKEGVRSAINSSFSPSPSGKLEATTIKATVRAPSRNVSLEGSKVVADASGNLLNYTNKRTAGTYVE